MSEAAKFVALGEAINEAFSNFRDASTAWADAYEYGYKTGWDNASERAKNLRDPARLAEIQHLQEALRKKNEKYQRLREQYKRLKDTKRPRARAHICKKIALTPSPHWVWVAHIRAGARHGDERSFPTWEKALAWALARLKDI